MQHTGPMALATLTAASCLLIFGEILKPDQTFAGMDFLNLIYPRALLIQKTLLLGQIPLWNPYEWAGSPVLAAMQGAVFYPPSWVFCILPLPYAQQVSTFLHLALAATGAALLCRNLFKTSIVPAALSGVTYACSGFTLGRLEQLNVISTFAWTPWLFLTAVHLFRNRSGPLPFAFVCTMGILSGHPQTLLLALIGLGLFLLISEFSPLAGNGVVHPLRKTAILSLAGLLAGLLTCAQLLPTHELSAMSERVWPYADPYSPSIEGRHLLGSLLVPRYYNTLVRSSGRPPGLSEAELYMGMLTPFLAVAGLTAGLRQRNGYTPGVVALALFSFWFAMGESAKLAQWVMELIPFLKHSRGTARMLNCAVLSLALSAGLGAHQLTIWLKQRTPRAASVTTWIFLAAITADLFVVHRPELLTLLVRQEASRQVSPAIKALAETPYTRLYRFMAHDSNYYLDNRAKAVYQRRLRLQPNQGSLTGVRLLDGYEEGLLPTRAYANMLRRFNRNLRSDSVDAGLLAMLGSNHLLTDYPLGSMEDWLQIQRYASRLEHPLFLYRSKVAPLGVLPESELVRTFPDLNVKKLVKAYSDHQRVGTKLLQGYPLAVPGRTEVEHPLQELTGSLSKNPVISTPEFAPNRAAFQTVQTSGTLIFFGISYPGWKLSGKDAQPVSLRPRTAFFSTAEIDSPATGKYLMLRFQPFSFRLGLFVSLCTLSVLAYIRLQRIMP